MRTDDAKTRNRLLSDELLAEMDRLREKIREEAGELDIVAMLRRSREEH